MGRFWAHLAAGSRNPAPIRSTTPSILLGPDPARPGATTVLGVPLLVSPYVTDGDVWAIPQAFAFTTMRTDTRLTISEDAYFSSDRVGVKATTMRLAFGFPHPQAIVRIGEPDGS